MITTEVNLSALGALKNKILTLAQADTLLRAVTSAMLPITADRIHEKGLNAAGGQIGTYSDSYMKLRLENGNTADKKVILFFTGQMQNDYKVVPLSDTEYALGYSNQLNANKADWAEDKYGKIFALTDSEMEQVEAIVADYVTNIFK